MCHKVLIAIDLRTGRTHNHCCVGCWSSPFNRPAFGDDDSYQEDSLGGSVVTLQFSHREIQSVGYLSCGFERTILVRWVPA